MEFSNLIFLIYRSINFIWTAEFGHKMCAIRKPCTQNLPVLENVSILLELFDFKTIQWSILPPRRQEVILISTPVYNPE